MGKEQLTGDRHPAGKGVSVGGGHLSSSAAHSQAHVQILLAVAALGVPAWLHPPHIALKRKDLIQFKSFYCY